MAWLLSVVIDFDRHHIQLIAVGWRHAIRPARADTIQFVAVPPPAALRARERPRTEVDLQLYL